MQVASALALLSLVVVAWDSGASADGTAGQALRGVLVTGALVATFDLFVVRKLAMPPT